MHWSKTESSKWSLDRVSTRPGHGPGPPPYADPDARPQTDPARPHRYYAFFVPQIDNSMRSIVRRSHMVRGHLSLPRSTTRLYRLSDVCPVSPPRVPGLSPGRRWLAATAGICQRSPTALAFQYPRTSSLTTGSGSCSTPVRRHACPCPCPCAKLVATRRRERTDGVLLFEDVDHLLGDNARPQLLPYLWHARAR